MKIFAFKFGNAPAETISAKKMSAAEKVPAEIWQRVIRWTKKDVPGENLNTATHLSLAIPCAFRALGPERKLERAQRRAFAFVNGQTHKKWGMFASVDHPAIEQTELGLLKRGQTLSLNGLACRRPIRVKEQSSNYEMDLREWTYTLRDAVMSAEQRRNFSFLVRSLAQHLVVLDLSHTRVSLLYATAEEESVSGADTIYFKIYGDYQINKEHIRRDFCAMTSLQRLTLRGREINPSFVHALPLESLRLQSLDISFTSFQCLLAVGRDASVQQIFADDCHIFSWQSEGMLRRDLQCWAYPQATSRICVKSKDSSMRLFYADHWKQLRQKLSPTQILEF